MDHPEFIELIKKFKPRVSGPSAPAMGRVWGAVLAEHDGLSVEMALREWFRGKDKMPTPNELQAILRRSSQASATAKQIESPEVVKPCSRCGYEVRVQLHDDGGLVFKVDQGVQYVTRCPVCKGPHWAKQGRWRLPVPHPDHEDEWLPFEATEGAHLLDDDRKSWRLGDQGKFWPWLKEAIRNSQLALARKAIAQEENPDDYAF